MVQVMCGSYQIPYWWAVGVLVGDVDQCPVRVVKVDRRRATEREEAFEGEGVAMIEVCVDIVVEDGGGYLVVLSACLWLWASLVL